MAAEADGRDLEAHPSPCRRFLEEEAHLPALQLGQHLSRLDRCLQRLGPPQDIGEVPRGEVGDREEGTGLGPKGLPMWETTVLRRSLHPRYFRLCAQDACEVRSGQPCPAGPRVRIHPYARRP